jgi:uncharacterized protein involved in outer membrane biogenesis
MIQLDDFDAGDWSPEKGAKEAAAESKKARGKKAGGGGRPAALFSPEVLGRLDVRVNVDVESVLSGPDELGSGLMTVTLKEGRLSIDPVRLSGQGGSLIFSTSVKPGREASTASVRAVMENFDFGILARRAAPKTDMGGTLNLDVDLKSSAASFGDLLANGSGIFDFSARPENLSAGVIDMWAVNVIAALASTKDDEGASKIHCLIGRWSMEDGVLKPDAFVIDTSKIRICGKGEVNFKTESIDLKAAPTPKKPEFFSLATPVELKGRFSDFGVGIQAGGLFGTAVRFVSSPLLVPLERLIGKGLPEDGGDICGMAIGPEDRPTKPLPGCR